MKKTITMILTIAMATTLLFAFTGCGNRAEDTADEDINISIRQSDDN